MMKIYEASKLINEGEISPLELKKSIIEKIHKNNGEINAYITVCNNKISDRTDCVLWGIPLAIKDNICTKGIRTTAGSKMLCDFVPPYNATVIDKLIENGADIIGKTNMDEFGMGSDNSSSFFCATSNPVNYEFVPGGSSGGSAAAVKSGMALGALGSDTGGSIRLPAAFCGLYGLKPTYSLVSRYGLIAFASSLDTIGPICKSPRDCAIILDAIAGHDKRDATSAKGKKTSYFENINTSVKGVKIGIPEEFFEGTCSEIRDAIYSAVKNYENMGAIVEICSMKTLKYAVSSYYIISSAEAASNLARYDGVKFGKRSEKYETLEEMYVNTRSENFGDEVKRRILLGTFVLSEGYYDNYYAKAEIARQLIKREFTTLFEKYDALITPVSCMSVWKKGEQRDIKSIYQNDVCTASVSLAGLPAISIPCGNDKNNMPVGLQLIGNHFCEGILLNLATAYEEGGFYCGI